MLSDVITELSLSETSEYRKIGTQYDIIRKRYCDRFEKYLNQLLTRESQMIEEEKKTFDHIQEMMKSDVFQDLVGNDKYREKVITMVGDEYILGKSRNKLLNLKYNIKNLCDQYSYEYERYVEAAIQQVDKELKQVEASIKNDIENIAQHYFYSARFFNELSNAKLI